MCSWDALDEAFNVISRKGVILVVGALAKGPLRHNDLARSTGLENKQLSRTLRLLQNAGLVNRSVRASRPPIHVYYLLTPYGERLVEHMDALADWWEATERGQEQVPAVR